MKTALIIGGGPAGLMAADELSRAGVAVHISDSKPSLGRKLLMAGKSGLNLTKSEPLETFLKNYTDARHWLAPMINEFGPEQVIQFAEQLEQPVFVGTSGRVFPKTMKASPMLRSWLKRLQEQGVTFQTRAQWRGFQGDGHLFDTPEGTQVQRADAVVFALGGASWSRLGSDGEWSKQFAKAGIALSPFGAANAAIALDWSTHMQPHFGTPLKSVAFSAGPYTSRGEAVITEKGLEGSGIYSVSRGVREGHDLFVDLKPDWTVERVQGALERARGKTSLSNHLRRVLKLGKHELTLINEWKRPLPDDTHGLAKHIKALQIPDAKLRPMDEAISTSGGVAQRALTENLMLLAKPGVFCAGEMLDWEAPTGGYLLTACLATGRCAGRGALAYLGLSPTPLRV